MRKLGLSETTIRSDPTLQVGLKYYKNASVLFFINIASCLLMVARIVYIDIAVAGFMVVSYTFWWRYRLWELKNRDYLKKMGFDVRGN